MALINIDYETRSATDIKRGTWAYAEDPTTSVLTAFIEHEAGWRVFWTPEYHVGFTVPADVRAEYRWGMEWLRPLFVPGNIFIAHNAEFERAISEKTLHLPEVTWLDTMALADYLGFPGALDGLAKYLWKVGKDKEGYDLMMKMCKPSARYGDATGFMPWTTERLEAYARYNARDVDLQARFWQEYSALWADCEEPVYHWHQRVNRRGLTLDVEVAEGMREIGETVAGRAGGVVEAATRGFAINGKPLAVVGADLTRVEYLKDWLNAAGGHLAGWAPDAVDAVDEETLTAILEVDDPRIVPPIIRTVCEARLAVSLASIKKVGTALGQISGDHRLRGQYRYAYAGTHRWSSQGVQIQNLPRPNGFLEEEALDKAQRPQAALVTQLQDACRRRDFSGFLTAVQAVDTYAKAQTGGKATVSINDCLTSLIRPMFIPAPGHKLIGADFAQIEGRGAAWMAGDRAALDVYRANDAGTGPDVYCVMAGRIYGRTITKKDKKERQAGKAAELLCIAEGSLVLTDQGLVPIQHVTTAMKVWDGDCWVAHEGLADNGVQEVITYQGLTATPDHKVFVRQSQWCVSLNVAVVRHLDLAPGAPLCVGGSRATDLTPRRVQVYDLRNAGPRHRYTVSGVLVHNCGYGGGAKLLDGRHGADFAAAGVTAEEVVSAWRDLHRPICRYWRELEGAMRDAIQSKRGRTAFPAGPLIFERRDDFAILMHFPTGRTIRYHGAALIREGEGEDAKTVLAYKNLKKNGVVRHLWGGHLLENGCQSLCRDLLCDAALRCEAKGLPVVMHTHDELVFEVPDAAVPEASAIIRQEMATAPDWAKGFPIKGDPAVMIRYNKDC